MPRDARVGRRGLPVGPLLVLTILAAACGSPTRHPASIPSAQPPAASASNSTSITHSPPTGTAQSTAAAAPRPADPAGFALVVKTDAGNLPAQVAPMSVASRQLVDPPHDTPQQWDTAAWIVQAAYPAVHSTGTTYIYGHACHHHICPFTDLKQAKLGDPVLVTTATATLTYLIQRIGLSPKSASSLPDWASDSTVKNRLVLVTCEFENGDTSTNNIVIGAHLSSSTPEHSQS
jgi:LPXTG-site transpeptidase (sortase) family protein